MRLTAVMLFREILIEASESEGKSVIQLEKSIVMQYLQVFITALLDLASDKSASDPEIKVDESERIRILVESLNTLTKICQKFDKNDL